MTEAATFDASAARVSAIALHRQGRMAEAASLYRTILESDPANPEIMALLAQVHMAAGDMGSASALAEKAVGIVRRVDTLSALAKILQRNGAHAEAAALFIEADKMGPPIDGIVRPMVNSLIPLYRYDDAYKAVRRLIAAEPQNREARLTLVVVLQAAGELEKASAALEGIPFEEGKLDTLLISSLSLAGMLGQLPKRTALTERLTRALDALPENGMIDTGIGLRLAFLTQFYGCSDAQKWKLLRHLGHSLSPKPAARPPFRTSGGRMRIGYLSPNFGDHPTSHLLAPIFEAHDRSRFMVHAYSTGDHSRAAQDYPKRLRAGAEVWRDCPSFPDSAVAQQIRDDGIDVLIDLGGYQSGSRANVLAMRPAAMQIHWIMQLGAMPAPFIDYSIVDKHMVPGPPDDAQHGPLMRMPHAFQPGYRQEVGEAPSRTECGLPEAGAIFCAFNNPLKIEAEVFAAWMEILRRVPGSVLWLSGKKEMEPNLRKAAGEMASRLVFAPRLDDRKQHLGRQKHAALYLDAFTFNGATSAMDALLAGVPVLTRRGSQAYGRIGTGFMNVLGMPELICADTATYIERAVALANDDAKLTELKKRVAAGVASSPLFDASLFTIALEGACEKAFEGLKAGGAAASFDV